MPGAGPRPQVPCAAGYCLNSTCAWVSSRSGWTSCNPAATSFILKLMHEKSPAPTVEKVDTTYLEGLIGYNARRAALVIIDAFLEQMAVYELRPVDFSVLSLIHHNP